MAHGVRQPKWDVYEAAVLLEGYLESRQGNRPKTHIIREVSETLREMAVNRGITIDDVFRNYNGISYQIKSMESAYCGYTAYVPSTKLFDEIVEIANIDFIRNGAASHVPGNISLSFKYAEGEMLLHRMDLMGISVSTGSACDSVNTQISHVLKAINLDEQYAKGTIRVSFGKDNTVEDASIIADAIIKILQP